MESSKNIQFIIVNWCDDSSTLEKTSKVHCSSVTVGGDVTNIVKGKMWTGIIESVWGKPASGVKITVFTEGATKNI